MKAIDIPFILLALILSVSFSQQKKDRIMADEEFVP